MDVKKQQQVCIKFCLNLGQTATEALEKIQKVQSFDRTQVFMWHVQFEADQTSVDDNDNTEQPLMCATPENVTEIQQQRINV